MPEKGAKATDAFVRSTVHYDSRCPKWLRPSLHFREIAQNVATYWRRGSLDSCPSAVLVNEDDLSDDRERSGGRVDHPLIGLIKVR